MKKLPGGGFLFSGWIVFADNASTYVGWIGRDWFFGAGINSELKGFFFSGWLSDVMIGSFG